MAKAPIACYFLLLLVLAATTIFSSQSVHTIYLIRPNSSTPCPSSMTFTECLSFDEFAKRVIDKSTSITLEVLPGIHYLSTSTMFYNLKSITIRSLSHHSTVRCTKPATLYFYNITYLEINELLIDLCGGSSNLSTMYIFTTSQAALKNVTITNSYGSALSVYNSSLALHSTGIIHCGSFDLHSNTTQGGAVNAYHSDLVITGYTLFSGNSAFTGGAIFLTLGSLTITGIAAFTNNTAVNGGGVCIISAEYVELSHRVYFISNTAQYGGALLAVDVLILENSGIFYRNNAKYSGAIGLMNTFAVSKGMVLQENYAVISGGGIDLNMHSTLHIDSDDISLIDGNIAMLGGAMYIYDSEVIINTTTQVNNNSATEGGGCYISGQSHFILGTKASLQFSNNAATYKGGAIYAEMRQECNFDTPSDINCLFVVERVDKYIILWNNSAESAGNILYGGNWKCEMSNPHRQYNIYNISIIGEDSNANRFSNIASDPYELWFCENEQVQWQTNTAENTVYPGQRFNISVVTVGQVNGFVPSAVQARLEPNSQAKLGDFQSSQETTTTCTNLTFILYSKSNFERITLTTGLCSTVSAKLQRYLNVTLLECPQGFQLADNPPQCVCHERLLHYAKDCTIDNQKIHRTNNFWVYYDNVTQGLVLHPHCPFDYCTPPPNNFTLQHSDQLCNYNRTRLLCGQCRQGLSLALGTSQCLRCSNYYLALVAAFAAAGLALVFFLFICKITVARGTINGLVFYANIVHINRTLVFPAGKINILTVFIAWLNLDLGLETCFYHGMDTYARTWLQFVFPVYVWILCGCIVFISRRSYHMSRILGTNPVAVLATLFLFSYTKLLRTAMATLAFTTLSYPHNQTRLVWLYDANVAYLQGKHIPLFVVGLATLLLCLPYTMLLLTGQWLRAWSNYRLLRWVNSPRLKFLLDAYDAPYKPKHRYWTGLLLFTRLLLYLVYSVNALGNTSINLLATSIATAALAVWMGTCDQPYKSRLLGALEASFLLNMIILAVSTPYIQAAQGNQGALAYTSTALSLAVLVAVIAFHSYCQIRNSHLWKIFTTKKTSHPTTNEVVNNDIDEDLNKQGISSRSVTHSEIVLPQHGGHFLQRPPRTEMHSYSTSDTHHADNEGQSLEQRENKTAHGLRVSISSMDSSSSQESWDNLSIYAIRRC